MRELRYGTARARKILLTLRAYLAISVIFFLLFANFQQFAGSGPDQPETATEFYSKAMFILFPMFGQSWLITIVKTVGVYFIYMATLGIVFDVLLASNILMPF